MAEEKTPDVLGQTIVNFARDGTFPEEDEISKSYLEEGALASALKAVETARSELEDEVKKISRESAPEIDTWIKHAKALEEDIEKTKAFADEIILDAEAGNALYKTVKDDEDHIEFLEKEILYNTQLNEALKGIKVVKEMLDEAEEAGMAHRILEALNILSSAWSLMGSISAHEISRPSSVLNARSFELKDSFHENFNNLWGELVSIDKENGIVTITDNILGGTDIPQAILIMKAYKDEEKLLQQFYEDFDDTIIRPRVILDSGVLKSIVVEGNTIRTSSEPASLAIKDLFLDLEKIVHFLSDHFPPDFARPLSTILMPKLSALIKETWLDSAVPVSLDDMRDFRKAIALVQVFAETITNLGWDGDADLHDWVENAPRLWVTKRRETSLDYTRRQLAIGIRSTKEVTRTETQTITESEGEQLSATNNDTETSKGEHDWDAAWSDDEGKDSEGKGKSSASFGRTSSEYQEKKPQWTAEILKEHEAEKDETADDDDAADAWGWGDEDEGDVTEPVAGGPTPMGQEMKGKEPEEPRQVQREVTLTETYTISSMPDPVFKTITDIIEDGVTLTREENVNNPITAAAVGLFALPTLVLAMYRAVSPWHYNLSPGGNMYCYNDAMYLAEQLKDFVKAWSSRDDLGPRAQGKVRLDSEIEALEKFSRRAYGNEMSTQRTIITDLLGGAQNFLQQGDANDNQLAISSVVAHIRQLSKEWKKILSKSAWAQAIGSLLSALAKKIIIDVEDLTSLGADEAYRVASLISMIIRLDDLFLPSDASAPQIPLTSQYAPNWLKLNFLSEVLQSDLKDLKYLWFESDLSVYFSAQEVVELIELSFESNPRTREAIVRIREEPFPRGVVAERMV